MSAPKLRFKEFDGDWTKIDLSTVSKVFDGTHQTPNYVESGIKFVSVENIHSPYESDKFITEEAFKKDFKNQPQLNDILMTRITAGEIGATAIVDDSEPLAYYVSLALIRPKAEVNTLYLNQYIGTPFFKSELHKRIIHVAFPKKINLGDINECLVALPNEAVEQTKIASFLSAVDEKVSQLTQKHQLLSQYKQGMMQKLFSQQIRFKADDGSEFGEWEDKTISDIASYRRGSFPQPYGLPEWLDENGFPFVQVYDVAENMLLKDKTKIKISQLAANQSVLAKAGTLIITLQGSIGRVAKMQYDAYVDRTLLIFQSYAMPIDTDYFKYALYLLFNIEKEKADGGIIKTITKETLSKFNIGIPCLEEQTKIANFLSAIDQKIDVASEQLEQAKLWKKGLLQQMFV